MSSSADRAKALHKEAPDLSKSSLSNLSYLLRHRELWPEGFVWDYRFGKSCALGLNYKTWGCAAPNDLESQINTLNDLESQINTFYFQPPDSSPEHIANLIDEYVAKFQN